MQHLEIETPEHIILDLEIAGVGSRGLATVIDTAILIGSTLTLGVLVATLFGIGINLGPWVIGLFIVILGAGWLLYFIVFEGLRQGQTPGKRIVGIRVVSDTGHAVSVGAAAVRNMLRLADMVPPPYLTGMVLVALHPRGKRLGDLAAGTVVVRDRPAAAPQVSRNQAPSAADTAVAEIPELDDTEFGLLASFAARVRDLPDAAAAAMAVRVGERLRASSPLNGGLIEHLLDLHARELARRQGRLGGTGRGGSALRFTERKLLRWNEFQQIAERASREGLDRFAAEELPDFAARYREVAADLARARTYHADPPILARLERLVAAGHNALYRDERQTWKQIWAVLARECPAAVVQSRRVVVLACLLFVLPGAAGFVILRDQPSLAAEIVPETMLRRAEAGAERQASGLKYYTAPVQERPLTATWIISNNVRVAVACFAGGMFAGVGSLFLLAFNGLVIGVTAGHFANMGLLDYLLEFIIGHGILELFAIWVAGAAGFLLGRAVVAPGTLSRADALVLASRNALRMVGASAVLLVVAGIIEGFVSAGGGTMRLRAMVSAGSLIFLGLYLANGAASLAATQTERERSVAPGANNRA